MTALVALDPTACPDCGALLRPHIEDQPALVRHGGYGATARTVRLVCPDCGWQLTAERTETRPDRRAS